MKKENFFSRLSIFFLLLFTLSGCANLFEKEKKVIGVDPLWYNMHVTKLDARIFGFVENLLLEFSEKSSFAFERYKANWNSLIQDLYNKKYDAIIAEVEPTVINKSRFNFSEIFLENGPVLVMQKQTKYTSLQTFSQKHVAVPHDTYAAMILQENSSIIVETYSSVAQVLEQVASNEIDAAVIDHIPAAVFITNIYENALKMSAPLQHKGLRMVVRKNDDQELLHSFNSFIQKQQRSKQLVMLKDKWELN